MTPNKIPMSEPTGIIGSGGVGIVRGDSSALLFGPGAVTCVDAISSAFDSGDGADAIRSAAGVMLRNDVTAGVVVVRMADADHAFAFGDIELVTREGRVSTAGEVVGVTKRFEQGELVGVVALGGELGTGWQQVLDGVVDAAGLVFDRAGSETGAAQQGSAQVESGQLDDVHVEPTPTDPVQFGGETSFEAFESVDLREPIDPATLHPLPLEADGPDAAEAGSGEQPAAQEADLPTYQRPVEVLGVMSPRGYFNHPDARYCSRSGVKMGASQTRSFVKGNRPALGVITFDDGSSHTVQWDTVMGRDPSGDERVQQGTAEGWAVDADELTVSRRHLFLELRDWDVLVSDLATPNGTRIRQPDDAEPHRLAQGETAVLNHGTEVFIGNRSFIYHEHHTR